MTHSNGSYKAHLSDVKELLARLDERQRDIRADILDVKAEARASAARLARHDERLAALDARQKGIIGALALVGGAVATVVVETLLK